MSEIQKIHCQPRWDTMGPARTMPVPPPTPRMADSKPMAVLTRCGANASLMMANARGNTAPALPRITRPGTSTDSDRPTAAITQPAASTARAAMRILRLPHRSPILPATGVGRSGHQVSGDDPA